LRWSSIWQSKQRIFVCTPWMYYISVKKTQKQEKFQKCFLKTNFTFTEVLLTQQEEKQMLSLRITLKTEHLWQVSLIVLKLNQLFSNKLFFLLVCFNLVF
jgi:hypothetical protein